MPSAAKLLIGVAAVVLLTWLWLGPLGGMGGEEQPATPTADAGEAAPPGAESEACRARIEQAIGGEAIRFRPGSPYINPAGTRLLDRIADAAEDCSGVRIAITGHSDRGGGEALNMEMSAYRATAVRDALVERGLPAAMLHTEGRGSAEPIGGDPADPANRRVEFAVEATR